MGKVLSARPYHARAASVPREDSKHGRDSVVTIFNGDDAVGSYRRNHGAFGSATFEPFESDGVWYALYSCDYTSTRVMKLPECVDLGGESPAPDGFCPVEFYVPRFRSYRFGYSSGHVIEGVAFEPTNCEATVTYPNGEIVRAEWGPWQSLDIGLVAGCIWGDDGTYKLQVFDLSRASDGVIPRDDRFGYLELVDQPLPDAVTLKFYDGRNVVTILCRQERDLETGTFLDPVA